MKISEHSSVKISKTQQAMSMAIKQLIKKYSSKTSVKPWAFQGLDSNRQIEALVSAIIFFGFKQRVIASVEKLE